METGFRTELMKIEKETIICSLFSILMYQSGYLLFLFLIPLQFLRERKGFAPFVQGAILVIAAAFFAAIFRTGKLESASLRSILIISETYMGLIILAGFIYINYDWQNRPRMLKKLIIATFIAALAAIPGIFIFGSDTFQNFYKNQIALILEVFNKAVAETQASDVSGVIESLNVEVVYATMKKMVLRSFLFTYFLLLTVSWWLGSLRIVEGRWKNTTVPSQFTVPEIFIWPLIISLTAVVIDYKINTGVIGYLGWNILLILIFIYGIRGIGILQELLSRAGAPAFIRILIFLALGMFLLQPGLNLIVLIAVPGLGVSEIWINYKKSVGE